MSRMCATEQTQTMYLDRLETHNLIHNIIKVMKGTRLLLHVHFTQQEHRVRS